MNVPRTGKPGSIEYHFPIGSVIISAELPHEGSGNRVRTQHLGELLRAYSQVGPLPTVVDSGYWDVTPVTGRYRYFSGEVGEEQGFLVAGITLSHALHIARLYGQESIFVVGTGLVYPYYESSAGVKTPGSPVTGSKVVPQTGPLVEVGEDADFFTELVREDGSILRVSAPLDFDAAYVPVLGQPGHKKYWEAGA